MERVRARPFGAVLVGDGGGGDARRRGGLREICAVIQALVRVEGRRREVGVRKGKTVSHRPGTELFEAIS